MAHTHTHDNIDWPARLAALRRADDLDAVYDRQVADRLVGVLGDIAEPVVVDIGSGGGGMSAAFAQALAGHGGGRVVLCDAVGELLDAATGHVRDVAAGTAVVVEAVHADASSDQLADLLPPADLVWASRVVHHLPDQQRAIDGLTRLLAPGGWLALGEGGLSTKCLPWDLGIGEPGLGDRLTAARDNWFVGMRSGMSGVKSLPVGWNKALWRAAPFESPAGPGLRLAHVSPDGDQGFPGRVQVGFEYQLTHDNRLLMSAHATTDAPTVVSMTNHSYFNLAADPAHKVLDTELQIFAPAYTPRDATGIPTGEVRPVAGTSLDFTQPKPIGRDLPATGYDDNLVLDGSGSGQLRKAAFARDPTTGRTLELWTDQPGVQLYSAHWLHTVGKRGRFCGPESAFCLEAQHFPDSPNKPQFPSTTLRPGGAFTWRAEYRLGVDR